MRNTTRQILKRICEADLLCAAGDVFEDPPRGIVVITEWQDAFKYSASEEWESVQLRKQNELSSNVRKQAPKEAEKWNQLVDEIKSILNPAIEPKAKAANAASKPWPPHVVYDLLIGCMEAEYQEFCEPDCGTTVLEWYLQGRFPCGWGSCLPGGRIKLTEVPATNVPFTPETSIMWPVLEHLSGSLERLRLPGKLLVF